MSWLYQHREQLDGLKAFVEIAYRLTYEIPSADRDDVEQDIVIALMDVAKTGKTDERYLWQVARHMVAHYWLKTHYQAKKTCRFEEGNKGEITLSGNFVSNFVSNGEDIDARLDAISILATLPKRIVEIGEKKLNGEKLSSAEVCYMIKHRKKLREKLKWRKQGDRLSEWEKKRIVLLHKEGKSVCKIAGIMGRSERVVMLYLFKAGLRKIGPSPFKIAANKR